VRNSKQQFAQTYLPHRDLVGKNTDEQIGLCQAITGNDWQTCEDNKKFGRLFYKIEVEKMTDDGIKFMRNEWTVSSERLTNDDVRLKFIDYLNNR
jgi:hypothetical protein